MGLKNGRGSVVLMGVGLLVIVVCLGLASTTSAYTEDQANLGAHVFAFYCSTCHGDRGQGLTDAWRATWDSAHQNCWTPKCHGLNHPPSGFVIPRYVPAVIGLGTLLDMATAQDLYSFIKADMPYQDPSLLTEQERWALTAFLVREHGVPADGVFLDATTAATIKLKPVAPALLPTWAIASPVPHVISLAASPLSATPSPAPQTTASVEPLTAASLSPAPQMATSAPPASAAPSPNASWTWIVIIAVVVLVGGGLILMRLRRSR